MNVKYNSVLSFILLYLINFVTNIYGNKTCGIENYLGRDRIVNGHDLEYVRKYPWYAALVSANDNRKLMCGGTLIHERHVLTAAHCFKPYFESVNKNKIRLEDIYVVKLGINNICINEDEVQVFSAIKIHIEEHYYDNGRYYDIALMVLQARATNFVPICLPAARYETNNRTNLRGTIIGLGKEASNAWKTPCTVKEAAVPIQSDSICTRMIEANSNKNNLEGVFCAGYPEGKIDTCQGDSGGPLQVYRESSKSWMILGVTSFGYGCAQPKFYGVYTDVSHYLDWIHNKMQYDENQNYVFESTNNNVSKSHLEPSIQKRKHKRRAFNNWLSKILED